MQKSVQLAVFNFVAKVLVFVAEDKYAVRMSITTYIKNDLAAKLRSGRVVPVQLTLDSLAGHYKVSLTPVRAAVAELIDEGLLQKGENNRLTATSQADESSSESLDHAQLSEPESPELPRDPYDVIANDLVQISLSGEPMYLREEVTAEKYGISRSAIRNILHRLAGEGVLDHIPRRGWRLRPFRQDDLHAFIEVREALELKALELARPKLDATTLKHLLELNSVPTSSKALLFVNESLHDYFIATAGNAYIRDFFERQGRYYKLLFVWEDRDRDVALETMRQHREILSALLKKNWSAAKKSLSHHIRDNHPVLSRARKS